jgi:hypothetical protein
VAKVPANMLTTSQVFALRGRLCISVLQFRVLLNVGMDADLYDEFGNYIGPELESDEEEEEGYGDREPEAQEYDVSYS